jgi:hypothetical protein
MPYRVMAHYHKLKEKGKCRYWWTLCTIAVSSEAASACSKGWKVRQGDTLDDKVAQESER